MRLTKIQIQAIINEEIQRVVAKKISNSPVKEELSDEDADALDQLVPDAKDKGAEIGEIVGKMIEKEAMELAKEYGDPTLAAAIAGIINAVQKAVKA